MHGQRCSDCATGFATGSAVSLDFNTFAVFSGKRFDSLTPIRKYSSSFLQLTRTRLSSLEICRSNWHEKLGSSQNDPYDASNRLLDIGIGYGNTL